MRRLIAACMAVVMTAALCVVPASAIDLPDGIADFFDWSMQGDNSEYWDAIASGFEGGGGSFGSGASREELIEKYGRYTDGLKTDLRTTTLIDGGIRIYLPYKGLDHITAGGNITLNDYYFDNYGVYCNFYAKANHQYIYFESIPVQAPFAGTVTSGYSFNAPDGVYCTSITDGSGYVNKDVTEGTKCYANGYGNALVSFGTGSNSPAKNQHVSSYATFWFDFYPLSSESISTSQDISINSRPSSIIGDYGILGDDGTIIAVDKTIVDEGHRIVYNPVTNTAYNYTAYAYDYSDRSYNLTLEDGSTMKVVYGDENITIQEGDTVYNVYYLMSGTEDGSGSGGSGDNGSGGIGGAIGGLFDILGEIVYGIIEGAVNLAAKALDGLSGLLDLFKQLGETVVDFFGGFTGFLGEVFPFLPEETFTILNFGLILMIAAGVFRKFFK